MPKPEQYAAEMKEPMTVDRLIGILGGLRHSLGGGALVHLVVSDGLAYDIIGYKTQGYRLNPGKDFTYAIRLEAGHF